MGPLMSIRGSGSDPEAGGGCAVGAGAGAGSEAGRSDGLGRLGVLGEFVSGADPAGAFWGSGDEPSSETRWARSRRVAARERFPRRGNSSRHVGSLRQRSMPSLSARRYSSGVGFVSLRSPSIRASCFSLILVFLAIWSCWKSLMRKAIHTTAPRVRAMATPTIAPATRSWRRVTKSPFRRPTSAGSPSSEIRRSSSVGTGEACFQGEVAADDGDQDRHDDNGRERDGGTD